MLIAISASGDVLTSSMDMRFGRAKGFILYDTNEQTHSYIDNIQNLESEQGAGIQAAQNVINNNIEALITGHCGPKAFKLLSAANVTIYLAQEGNVKDQIEKLRQGKLKKADNPDVEGHW